MKRHYYISDDLDDLEVIEQQLEAAGVSTPQIHVLSKDDSGVQLHHLHQVEPVLKKDVVKGTWLGAVVGVIAAIAVLILAWKTGLTETLHLDTCNISLRHHIGFLHLGRWADWHSGASY